MTSPVDAYDGFGCGKVILFGEHAVVYGRTALASALNIGVQSRITRVDEGSGFIEIQPWNRRMCLDSSIGVVDPAGAIGQSDHIKQAWTDLVAAIAPIHANCFQVSMQVGLPGGAGLGCSAAMGVSLTRALLNVFGKQSSDAQIALESLAWEKVFHGRPSGLDSTMAAMGGVALFNKNESPRMFDPQQQCFFVVIDSGQYASTKDMVDRVRQGWSLDQTLFESRFDAIEQCTLSGHRALVTGDLTALGEAMQDNHKLLSLLGVSSEVLNSLCTQAMGWGGLGAKLTGAGGGGCVIALAQDQGHAGYLMAQFSKAGWKGFVTQVPADHAVK